MAEEIIYNIKANTKDAQKKMDSLNESLDKTSKGADGTSKDLKKVGDSASKAGKKGKKGLGLFKKGIKGIGTAIKASGLGLVAALMGAIFEVMRKNQKVLDAIETATNFIAVGFKAVSDAVTSAYDAVSESTDGFDALGKVMSGLLTIAISPLKLGFYRLKESMQQLKVGYETMFGSDESVKKAKADLAETRLAIMEVVTDVVDAGKDIYNNIGEAIDEVSEGTSALVNNISKIDPKKLVDQASNMTKLGNAAAIAAAKQAGLVEEYDRQAESQRQIRDDESLSIEARKKANEELGKILKLQQEAMLKEADLQLANAKAQYEVNKNQENYIALIDAETNRKGVLAQVNGFVSEQKVNAVALQKEEIELTLAQKEADATLAFEKRKFAAEQITDNELRIATLLSINEDERIAEIARLEEKRDNFKQGTQAYVDAQIELNAKKAEFAQTEAQLKADDKVREREELQVDVDNKLLEFETRREALASQRQTLIDDEALTEQERTRMLKENSEARKAIDREEIDQKERGLAQVANAMGAFSDLAGKETAAGKTIAVAGALINTYLGASQVLRDETLPTFGKIAGVAAVLASGFKSVKAITAVRVPKGGGASGGSPTRPSSPQFNVVGQSPNSVGNAQNVSNAQIQNSNNNPTRAYVVSTDISNQQSLDRDIEEDNSLG